MARARSDLSPQRLAELQQGAPSRDLVEILALDFAQLWAAALPDLPPPDFSGGITARMQQAGRALPPALLPRLCHHSSDTVRGWAAYGLAWQHENFASALAALLPAADDAHFGVREWAWLALRPHLATSLNSGADALRLLLPLTQSNSANLRRFASELTRPRGVWCAHLPQLRQQPQLGLPLLSPLFADPSRYVQNSVANWLNDAAKDKPDWVRQHLAGLDSNNPSTAYIIRRASRNLKA